MTLAADDQAVFPNSEEAVFAEQPDGTIGPVEASPEPQPVTPQAIAVQLRKDMSAVRLHRGKWGISKKLDRDQTDRAALAFNADGKALSASKKIVNSKDDCLRKVNGTLAEAVHYWKSVTIPYPEDGVRLIRRERIDKFNETMTGLRQQLRAEAQELEAKYQELVEEAKGRLGELYNENDYPASVKALYRLEWDFPSVEPPPHLLEVAPQVYAQEMARIQARFELAVSLTEDAFADQFAKLLEKLTRQLSFGEPEMDPATGQMVRKPKAFYESSIEGLQEFFDRFKALNVGGSEELEALIAEAKAVVGTTDAKTIRKDVATRGAIEHGLADVANKLNQMMQVRPIRQMNLLDEE